MNRRISLTLGAAAGGLLASAFLPVAVAFADSDPFTTFLDQAYGTATPPATDVTLAGNLDTALNTDNAGLATTLGGDVSTGSVPFGIGEAPPTDNAFAELLPTGASAALQNEAASYDAILFKDDPTLAATLAVQAANGSPAFPDAPGADAFTLGSYEFDPYTLNAGGFQVEGFAPATAGTGTPGYFDTGTVDGQNFDVYTPATSTTAASALGSIDTNENVTSLFGITNTGFDVTSVDPTTPATDASLPSVGTIYDVTNFGSGYENIYTDVPGAAATATTAAGTPTVTDIFVTPFGDENLSSMVSAFDLSALDPGAAFGVGADAGTAAADAVGGVDPLAFLGL